ncbi:zinc finger protein 37 homolog isoform X1 [Takifugu rubripes]|uniref:Zinc finger protein 37 homolog n=1 Tax=Takifugu rubripes TaxID=31033 RepID=A0A3B5KKV5_TAKRU|nr:zinc finger protein 37 homolog isoform X1 [Takifugu rubripes]XP_029686015.1 zinc finger protein 37 homolog isoform X1 [Takifugu rubripes]
MSCSAIGCTNRHSKGSALQFFRFPLRDADRLKQWLRNVKRVNWIPSDASRLCSMHFVDNDFCMNEGGQRRLKHTAVPTIFNTPPHLFIKLAIKRSLCGVVDMSDSSLSPHLLPDRGHSTGIPSVEPHTAMTLKSMMFVSDQQWADRDRNIRLDREQPSASLTKEEEEEICISPEGKRLALKQEPDASLLIPTSQGRGHLLLSHLSDEDETKDRKQTSVGDGTEAESMESLHKNETHSCNVAHSSNFLVFHTYSLPLSESFECQMCGKDFRSECRLNEHVIIHTEVKPFSCDTCGKSFRNSSSLSAHRRLHGGEEPHSCTACGMCFRRRSSLTVHTRVHTGEKPNSCKTCGEDFPFASTLNCHLRIHTCDKPNLCHKCGKRFCQKRQLMLHTRVHAGERPYLCKTCGLNFKRSDSLKIHMRRHESEKPFSCQRCGKKFRARGCLTTHTRKIHTEKPYRCKLRVEEFSDRLAKHIRPHADN